MKIALIAFHFAEYTYRLACALAEQHQVLLILNANNAQRELGQSLYMDCPAQLEIILLQDYGLLNPRMLLNSIKIISAIREFSPDVLHCQESPKDYLMAALLFIRKYPFVLTIHDHVPHSGQDANSRKRIALYKWQLRKIADVVIVHGEHILEETGMILPRLKGLIFSISHGPLGEPPPAINPPWEDGALLFFGRIEKYKGLPYLIEAVKILRNQGVHVKSIIAGTGQDLELYRDEITANPIFELIDRYIPSEEVPALFGRANVVVLPYTDATQSGVVAMALQYGRPIVASDVGSIGEMVKDGFNGFLVPPQDSIALANAIKRLISDSALAVNMGKNAVDLVKGELSWSAIAQKTLGVYQYVRQRR